MGQRFQTGKWFIPKHHSQKGLETNLCNSSLYTGETEAIEWEGLAHSYALGGEQGRPRTQVPPHCLQTGRRQAEGPGPEMPGCGRVRAQLAPSLGTSVPWSPHPSSCPAPPTGALEIGQVLPIHAGRYICTARNSAGVAHKHVALAVQGRAPRPPGQTAQTRGAGSGCRARSRRGWGRR